MKLSTRRMTRLVTRRRADRLIIALWLLVAMFAALMLFRGEGASHVSARHACEHVRI